MAGAMYTEKVTLDYNTLEWGWLISGLPEMVYRQEVTIPATTGKIVSGTPMKVTTAADEPAGVLAEIEPVAPTDTIDGWLLTGVDATTYAGKGVLITKGEVDGRKITWHTAFTQAEKLAAIQTLNDNMTVRY